MRTYLLSLAFVLAACGGAAPIDTAHPTALTTTSGEAATGDASPETTTPKTSLPSVAETSPETTTPKTSSPSVAETPSLTTPAPSDDAAEACDGGWVCLKVSFDRGKVEKRTTKLIGDPQVEETWSKNSDGRSVSFDAFSKGAITLTLRRKPGNKNEVVVKLAKGKEVVIDRREGTVEDFTHVAAIAAEQDGAFLVDLRYMR